MKLFSCSTLQIMKFIMLITVKMPTIVGILTFISRINTTSDSFKTRSIFIFSILAFMSNYKLVLSLECQMFITLGHGKPKVILQL